MVALLVFLTLALAFANGANDVSKGIATLVGSGVSNYRLAVIWGAIWTIAGALTAGVFTQALVATFSGKGLLRAPLDGHAFLFSVACGAIAWLLIATGTGLPVSTTHALTGALCGAGIAAQNTSGVIWSVVAKKAALPLAVSPLLSLAIVISIYPFIRLLARRYDDVCVCVTTADAISDGVVVRSAMPGIAIAPVETCARSPLTLAGARVIEPLHWLASGATSFFRGLNDTPKILAVGVAAASAIGVTTLPFYGIVAVAMGAGSIAWGFRVTQTLARKVTPISPTHGFTANLVTSLLVAAASLYGLPVSTTHVATGSILGTGLAQGRKNIRWSTVGQMALAWLVTLPAASVLGGGAYMLLS